MATKARGRATLESRVADYEYDDRAFTWGYKIGEARILHPEKVQGYALQLKHVLNNAERVLGSEARPYLSRIASEASKEGQEDAREGYGRDRARSTKTARDTHRFRAAEQSGRAHALHKLAKRGGSHTYATPEVKRTASYKRAERLEEQLAPRRWLTPGLTRREYERLADAWERAGFLGWADNYRAHVEQHKIGRDEGPVQRSRMFFKRQSAEEFREKILDKHPEARVEAIPTSYAKRSHARYRVMWKSARDPGTRHRHRTPSAPSFAKQKLISKKIRLLVREGYPPKQAAAIAYRMYGASRKA